MHEVINLFRTNPRSFIKYIYHIKANLKEQIASKQQSTFSKKKMKGNLAKEIEDLEERIAFCKEVKHFLCKVF